MDIISALFILIKAGFIIYWLVCMLRFIYIACTSSVAEAMGGISESLLVVFLIVTAGIAGIYYRKLLESVMSFFHVSFISKVSSLGDLFYGVIAIAAVAFLLVNVATSIRCISDCKKTSGLKTTLGHASRLIPATFAGLGLVSGTFAAVSLRGFVNRCSGNLFIPPDSYWLCMVGIAAVSVPFILISLATRRKVEAGLGV